MIKEYIKPDFKYWSEGELNSIEAKMSGNIGWHPNIQIISASYDGSIITATYRVYDTITSDIDYRIGYQYAGSFNVLTMYQMSRGISINKTAGIYIITLSAPNRNCEIRLCVGRTDGDTTKVVYSTIWSWIKLPAEPKLKTYTVSKAVAIGWIIMVEGVSFIADQKGAALKILLTAKDISDVVCILFEHYITPQFNVGNYFRVKIYYADFCLYMEFKEWEDEDAYKSKKATIFEQTLTQKIPRFSGSKPVVL